MNLLICTEFDTDVRRMIIILYFQKADFLYKFTRNNIVKDEKFNTLPFNVFARPCCWSQEKLKFYDSQNEAEEVFWDSLCTYKATHNGTRTTVQCENVFNLRVVSLNLTTLNTQATSSNNNTRIQAE